MTTRILKCSNCNIVICEVLAFIQNKIDVMSEDSLVRICSTSFSVEEIENAKSLLFESVTTSKRKRTRRREGRMHRDLFDVISLFKETDPELTPTFVARDLQKLPPVHFDHLDATKLLKDILVIQKEIQTIKESYVTEDKLNEIKNELYNLKSASLVNNNFDLHNAEGHINTKRGGGILTNSYYLDSSPIEPPYCSHAEVSIANHEHERSCATAAAAATGLDTGDRRVEFVVRNFSTAALNGNTFAPAQTVDPAAERGSCMQYSHKAASTPEPNGVGSTNKLLAKVVTAEGEWKAEEPNEQWILAQRKRYRNRFSTVEGKARNSADQKFKAADIRVPLFVNNVDKTTSENDIVDYIYNKTQVRVILHKIKSKVPRQYSAYKMLVPNAKLTLFLDNALWPEGVAVRKFVNFKHNYESEHTQKNK